MRYVLGFIGLILLVVLVIVLIARVAGGGSTNSTPLTRTPELAEYADSDASFTLTEYGPIVADEKHVQIRITVSRFGRRVEVIRGYENTVIAQENYNNNQNAFGEFLAAIDRQGYTKERISTVDTERGLCSSGKRFVFESNQGNENFRRWSTSCGNAKGTVGGSLSGMTKLFQDQIPEYNQFIGQVRSDSKLAF